MSSGGISIRSLELGRENYAKSYQVQSLHRREIKAMEQMSSPREGAV